MLLWAHGMLGSPAGAKVHYLRAAGVDLVAPDLRDLELIDRIARARAVLDGLLRDGHRVQLGGSSLGGLVVAVLAAERPSHPLIEGMVLAAPAVHICGEVEGAPAGLRAPPGLPVHIVHGSGDAVVPPQASLDFAARSGAGVTVELVDDDHRLGRSLPRILAAVRAGR